MKRFGFFGGDKTKSEAHLIQAGELLVCECDGLTHKLAVVDSPRIFTSATNGQSKVLVARVRNEQNQLTQEAIEQGRDFQVLLVNKPSTELRWWLRIFLDARSPLLWTIHASGVVKGGPWKEWEVVIGEPWTGVIDQNKCLQEHDLNHLYTDGTQGMFSLHEQGLEHGAIASESFIEVGSPGVWKLLPPLRHNVCAGEDDIRAFGRLIHFQLLGATAPDDPTSLNAFSGASKPWQTILDGCLHPEPEKRWTAGRAIFGSQPLPIPDKLVVQAQGENRVISWDPPRMRDGASIETALYELRSNIAAEMGTVRGIDVLERAGTEVLGVENPVLIHRPVNGRRFQVVSRVTDLTCPVVIFGPMVILSDMPEVELQEVKVRDGCLHALWDWPESATAVLVCIRGDRYPSFPDEAERSWRVGHGRHRNSAWHSWPMDGECHERLYVTAFAIDETTSENRTSSGAALSCRWSGPGFRHRIDYKLTQAMAKRSSIHIQLESRAAVKFELPQLVLGACRNHAPKTLVDADYRVSLPQPLSLQPGRPSDVKVECESFPKQKALRARLFTANGAAFDWLDLACNPPSGLKLS